MKSTISRSVFSKVGDGYLRIRKFQRCASTLSHNSGHSVIADLNKKNQDNVSVLILHGWLTNVGIRKVLKCLGLKHFVFVDTESAFAPHCSIRILSDKVVSSTKSTSGS